MRTVFGMRFEFATAARILFGPGVRAEAAPIVADWGRRAFLLTGTTPARCDWLRLALQDAGIEVEVCATAGEPSVDTVRAAADAARRYRADSVIGCGGGSALDSAKAVAGLLTNPGDPLDYLEVVGRGRSLSHPAAPWLAIPTTAGTGAEATRNAVLGVPERGVKASLRSPHLYARAALVDPELTLNAPASVTAAAGMDALTQLLEAYVCLRANPATDALCAAGLPRVARALPTVQQNPSDLAARSDLALGALWSGMALSGAGLGAVHGLAAPIGGLWKAPHGAVCAVLLAPVMAANLAALRRSGTRPTDGLRRYGEVAGWLTGRSDASPEEGVEWVRSRAAKGNFPRLSDYGASAAAAEEVATRALAASSMKANPASLTVQELAQIFLDAL